MERRWNWAAVRWESLAWFFFSGHGGHSLNQRVAETVPTEKSIAVFPFENISSGVQLVPRSADGKFYLMVIDTACPSPSNRAGKVTDSA
jgi:hypothetical protein